MSIFGNSDKSDGAERVLYAPEYSDLLERYFLVDQKSGKFGAGCLGGKKLISDNEYLARVMDRKKKFDTYNRAISYVGIDSSSVQEIEPIELHGFVRGRINPLSNTGPERPLLRGCTGMYTNIYEDTWMFFTEHQMLVYTLTFDMLSRSIKDESREIFYKDVTSFSINNMFEEVDHIQVANGCSGTKITNKKSIIKYMTFRVVVPGEDSEELVYSMTYSDDLARKINAMKHKLREKKTIN